MKPKNSRPAAAQVPYGCPSIGNPYNPTGITPPNLKDSRLNGIPKPLPGVSGSPVANCPMPTTITKYPVIVRNNLFGEVLKGTFITNGFSSMFRRESPEDTVKRLCENQRCTLLHVGEPETATAYLSYEDNIRILDAGLEHMGLLLVEKAWPSDSEPSPNTWRTSL